MTLLATEVCMIALPCAAQLGVRRMRDRVVQGLGAPRLKDRWASESDRYVFLEYTSHNTLTGLTLAGSQLRFELNEGSTLCFEALRSSRTFD